MAEQIWDLKKEISKGRTKYSLLKKKFKFADKVKEKYVLLYRNCMEVHEEYKKGKISN